MRILISLIISIFTQNVLALEVEHLDRVTPEKMAPIYSEILVDKFNKALGHQPPLLIGPKIDLGNYDLNQEIQNLLKYQLKSDSATYTEVLTAIPDYVVLKYSLCNVDGYVRDYYSSHTLDRKLCNYIGFESVARRELEIENALNDFKNSSDFSLENLLKLWNKIDSESLRVVGANDSSFVGAAKIHSHKLSPSDLRKAFGFGYMYSFAKSKSALDSFFGFGNNSSPEFKDMRNYIESSKNIKSIWHFSSGSGDSWISLLIIIDENDQAVAFEYNYG